MTCKKLETRHDKRKFSFGEATDYRIPELIIDAAWHKLFSLLVDQTETCLLLYAIDTDKY